MKLTSNLRLRNSFIDDEKIISENCTMAQAFKMIESWCEDNDTNYPLPRDIWKAAGNIVVRLVTRDLKYINIFTIS